ncbi:hypothetical protein [Klebsiella michiganensis]|uniref:hypothetical protein n=1 Tax=Klebsiella michiganensis TaxID=1134687 RepID=UPI0015E998A7|nr:hypothetical protein [Klebsiella michiganensis]QMR53424.1 hypothetical protein HV264_06070 [Klebsiella michiganensis]
MNIETVNELIQSLESAGELSIKETKVMALAKAYQQLAAENVGMKAGVTYFAYSPEYGFDYFKDKQSAIDTAQEEIDAYREDADDGWSEDVQRVSWGVVIQQAQGFDAQGLHTSDSQHTYQTCDYWLVDSVETPATDAYLAGLKADAAAPLVSALKVIANSEQHNGDTVVCDFDTLISVAAGALRDYYAKQLREGADK